MCILRSITFLNRPFKICSIRFGHSLLTTIFEESLIKVCEGIFIEIGTDNNYVHFLIQNVPRESPTKIIKIVKSIIAKEMFRLQSEIKLLLWAEKLLVKALLR